ncbi:MAG: Unknown protein [uncultured Sulfurovum sp.]|uniref:Lipoprotein n=1 Tax=uncultured Sulfurovum sp. TaxID=269237 RepID=A0A6S6UED0_9BACT|nr:MAG: Unknown protein [uncultured Sulfurovum sp.]
MIKWGLILAILVLLTGCASKKEKHLIGSYSEKVSQYKKLQKTESLLLSENNVTKVVMTATYLYENRFKKDDNESNETFIIGFYVNSEEIDNDSESMAEILGTRVWPEPEDNNETNLTIVKNDISDLNTTNDDNTTKSEEQNMTTDFELTLSDKKNGQKAIYIEELDKRDHRLKNLSFVSEWSRFALVKFAHSKKKTFKLKLKSKHYGSGELPFAKAAKFTFIKGAIF